MPRARLGVPARPVVIIMGAGTFLIGCLPTYGRIGFLAPVPLIALRLLQGAGLSVPETARAPLR